MKELESFLAKIEKVMDENSQYKFEAYSFIMAALHDTVSKLEKPRHISGPELLEGIRRYAIEQYGAMTRMVLNYWGVTTTEDMGKIVFALVEVGVLRKQPEDKIEDFRGVYEFKAAFDDKLRIHDDEP